MNESEAKKFAEEKFKSVSEEMFEWNYNHSKCMILALEEFCPNADYLPKLKALAWVHDIGKTIQDKNHAELSVKIIQEDFELDDIDEDCILNHGSNGNPESEEAKMFKYADGISLFYPETIELLSKKFGSKEKLKELYEKYKEAYSDSEKALEILDKNYNNNF